jgi:hypothetical protein
MPGEDMRRLPVRPASQDAHRQYHEGDRRAQRDAGSLRSAVPQVADAEDIAERGHARYESRRWHQHPGRPVPVTGVGIEQRQRQAGDKEQDRGIGRRAARDLIRRPCVHAAGK